MLSSCRRFILANGQPPLRRVAAGAARPLARRSISTLEPLVSLAQQAPDLEPLCGPQLAEFLKVAPGVAVQFVFLSPLLAVKAFRDTGTTGDVAVAPYAAMFANGVLWASYGVLLDNPSIALPNVSAIVLGASYCAAFYCYRSPQACVLPYFGAAGSMVAATAGAAATLPAAEAAGVIGSIGCVASVAMFAGPLASIRAVLRDRSAAAIPPAFTVVSCANTAVWV